MAREFKPIPDLTDNDIIPSGKYAKGGLEGGANGTKMIDVPAKYLMYVYDNNMCNARIRKYVEDNLDVLRQQAKDGL